MLHLPSLRFTLIEPLTLWALTICNCARYLPVRYVRHPDEGRRPRAVVAPLIVSSEKGYDQPYTEQTLISHRSEVKKKQKKTDQPLISFSDL